MNATPLWCRNEARRRLRGAPLNLRLSQGETSHFGNAITYTGGLNGTYFDPNGVLRTSLTDVIRLDHDPVSGTPLGPLIEEARENLCLQSEDFATTWADSAVTPVGVSINTTVAPDGNTTADTLTDDSAVNFEGLEQTFTVANDSTSWTATVYIKKDSDETRFPELQIQITGGTLQRVNVSLNTKTGAILERASTGTTVVSVQDAGDYWRLRVTVDNNTSGNVTLEVFLFPAAGITLGTIVATATGSIIAWGAVLENSGFPTSYIKTTTAAVTRSADMLTIALSDVPGFSTTEGTIFVEAIAPNAANTFDTVVELSDGTAEERIQIARNGTDPRAFLWDGNVQLAFLDAGTWANAASAKLALAWKLNDISYVADGGTPATDTAATIPTLTTLEIGGNSIASTSFLNGTVGRLVYRNVRQPNEYLQNPPA